MKLTPTSPLVYTVFLAAALGLLLGNVTAVRTIWMNDWLHYGLTRLAGSAFPASARLWVAQLIGVALVAHLLWLLFRRLSPASSAGRRFAWTLGAVTAALVFAVWAFHLNRYAYKELWRLKDGLPPALLSPRVWLANFGILLAALAAGFLVQRLLSWWVGRGAEWRGKTALAALAAVIAALALPAVGASGWLAGEKVPPRPSVVLISMDTLRADHLGLYGYERATSPALDAFAATGVVFEKAVTQANWTLPSFMSLMTSQIPSAHGVIVRENVLPAFKVTLAEILKNAGYRTQAITGGYYVDARFGFGQGFDDYSGDKIEYLLLPERRQHQKGVRFGHLLPRIVDWLAVRHERPYFLFLHAWDTHAPYLPHEAYLEQFSPEYGGTITLLSHAMVDEYQKTWKETSAEDVARIRALYDNEIRFVDDALGQILKAIRESPGAENTIVIFTSDHGDELFEHGIEHQWSLYEPETHVPLILAWPGHLPAGRRVREMVRTIDLLPTILDLTAVEVSPAVRAELQGKSLVGTWDGVPPVPWSVAEGYRGRQMSLRTNRFKYLRIDEKGLIREELFDLERDPGEVNDLSGSHPEQTAAMRQEMEDRFKALMRVRFAGRAQKRDLDSETIERLKSLGYVE